MHGNQWIRLFGFLVKLNAWPDEMWQAQSKNAEIGGFLIFQIWCDMYMGFEQ